MNTSRYSLPAIVLHWGQAVLVIWLLWLGWTMVDLPKGAERSAAYGLHKSLGLLTLLLVGVRLAWRVGHPPPASAATGNEARLAQVQESYQRDLRASSVAEAAGRVGISPLEQILSDFARRLRRHCMPEQEHGNDFRGGVVF